MDDSDPMMGQTERKLGTVDKSFYLIGVGASAGGLDALKQLVSQIPAGFPHSMVVVQHISPDYKSLMSEILGRETSLPVQEVTDNMTVLPGHIYLIPPKSNIVIQGTEEDSNIDPTGNDSSDFTGLRFSLVDPTPRPAMNLPIDLFFNSLAEAVQDRAVAIVLSGTGSDGSRGIRAVKDREGFVLVQDPETAAFDGMPRAAIASGIADLVLSPDGMVGEMRRYFQMRESGILNVASVFEDTDDELREVLALVSKVSEIDFTLYKKPTLKRRIARRMALAGYSSLGEYLERLRSDSAELHVLYREFLVGVTNFFRDQPVWTQMQETVLPDLFKEGNIDEPVRVWSVGCSTGEEAFTTAILLEDYRLRFDIVRDFRIYATDVNEAAIHAAKDGIYPDTVREEIPSRFIDPKFLTFQASTFSIAPSIRKRVIFSAHNVIEDPPFTRMDLIVCRNLLIYLSPEVQAKVMTQFSFSLRRGGILLLGAAETPGQHGGMFEAVVNKSRIYQNTRRIESARAQTSYNFPETSFMPRSRRMADRRGQGESELADLLIVQLEATESCVFLIESSGKLIRSFGKHDDIIQLPSGSFSPNLLEMVDERLRGAIALVLRSAELHGSGEKRNVRLADKNEFRTLDLSCRKIAWEAYTTAFALTLRVRDVADLQGHGRPNLDEYEATESQRSYI
ncbi:MAG: chemotaxis protein CheB, partial [Paracoccaceae bacterium]|nr:chemotaxis protein CheB [Paracoccaceae bacterium]